MPICAAAGACSCLVLARHPGSARESENAGRGLDQCALEYVRRLRSCLGLTSNIDRPRGDSPRRAPCVPDLLLVPTIGLRLFTRQMFHTFSPPNERLPARAGGEHLPSVLSYLASNTRVLGSRTTLAPQPASALAAREERQQRVSFARGDRASGASLHSAEAVKVRAHASTWPNPTFSVFVGCPTIVVQ